MRYSEIINFNPIESIIQLKDANDKDRAKGLVESYVMSNEMADKFDAGIINELQFDEVVDNKGVLIVGNYGTGKSHLMSVISSIVNNAENVDYLRNKKFAEHSKRVAGKFEVLRIEIGSVSNSLRNIIVSEVENDLNQRGVNYSFPSADTITNNKAALMEMMSKFEEKYPEKGYLLVIDELLDYLRTRKEHDLMLDLGFLRELGEFIKNSRFRLICGIQEQLFDNPAFSFVSKSLNRVKDRFEQVIIRKEDTAYVVSERILGKTPEQKAKVREHLLPFCSLYSEMSERIDDFVQLFPIHPSYIEIFNRVYIAEKREVLKTISLTVKRLLDQEVPEEAPGVISFDSYWNFIKDNYARKAEAEIKEVMEKSAVLEDKIAKTFSKKAYQPMALQIINALSVHRLTTSGIDVRIGLTVENLKDDLCLFIQNMPEMEAEFLISMIQTVLKDIITLVSGQFIEHNPDNNQYFLDLKKDIDYDAKIEQKADMMDDYDFNRYFYKLVYDALEWDVEQYVPNFEIYEYTLNWDTHNVFREGYLFMGLPSERSTAQPPRDFYIYFIPPYGETSFIDNKEPDEVYFDFISDDLFYSDLRFYSAAQEMKTLAADQNTKNIYTKKADVFRKKMQKWLNDNRNTCFSVIFKGSKKTLIEATAGKSRLSSDLKSAVDMASSIALSETFEAKYPDFPKFKSKITRENKAGTLERVIKSFSGKTAKDVTDYLESFGLIKEDKIDVTNSKYAMYIAKHMAGLSPQGVINRSEIVEEVYDVSLDKRFKVDLEYFTPVFLALVYTGHITMSLRDGTVLTASNMDITAKLGIMEVFEFKYISKPKQAAIDEIKRLFEIIGLPTGMAVNTKELQNGLDKILDKTSEWALRALQAKQVLKDEFNLWGEPLLPQHFANEFESQISIVLDEFGNFKNKYNTVAKLNNMNLSMDRIEDIGKGIEAIYVINAYEILKSRCESLVNYVSTVETLELPMQFFEKIDEAKDLFREQRDEIKNGRDAEEVSRNILSKLNEIKNRYIDFYIEKHQKTRLNHKSAVRLAAIKDSGKLVGLNRLKNIETVFSLGRLNAFERALNQLTICYELEITELQQSPICKHCKLKDLTPVSNVNDKVDDLENELEEIFNEWEQLLIQYIEDPIVLENKILLNKEQQAVIENFLIEKKLPETIDVAFVGAFNLLFSELHKVTIKVEDITQELLKVGPSTIEDLKKKINDIIDARVKGMDISKLRVIMKQDEEPYLYKVAEGDSKDEY